jgi:hypothetical protein
MNTKIILKVEKAALEKRAVEQERRDRAACEAEWFLMTRDDPE